MIDKLAQDLLAHAAQGDLPTCAALGITLAHEVQGLLARPAVSESDYARGMMDATRRLMAQAQQSSYQAGYDAGYTKGYNDGADDAEAAIALEDDDDDATLYAITTAGRAALGQQAQGGAA